MNSRSLQNAIRERRVQSFKNEISMYPKFYVGTIIPSRIPDSTKSKVKMFHDSQMHQYSVGSHRVQRQCTNKT